MTTTIEEVRRISDTASNILDGMFRAYDAADQYQATDSESVKDYRAREFLTALDDIVDNTKQLGDALRTHGSLFSAVNYAPVEVRQPPSSSVHEAIGHAGAEYEIVGWDVRRAAATEPLPFGRHILPNQLPPQDDLWEHVGVAVESFLSNFLTEEQANRVSAMREQELARVCAGIERAEAATAAIGPDSPDKIEKDLSDPEVDELIQRVDAKERNANGKTKYPIDIAREIVSRRDGSETGAQNLARERRRTLKKQRGNA